ncbi:hypothetical protein PO909_005850 [Leuciscus waleckii]
MPDNTPQWTLCQYIEFALRISCSSFSVGPVDEGSHELTTPVEPEFCYTSPYSRYVLADLPEPCHFSADLPEPRHFSADFPEPHHVSADRPEPRYVLAEFPEPSSRLHSLIRPGRLHSLIRPGRLHSLIRPGRLHSLIRPGRLHSLIRPGRLHSLIRPGRLHSLIRPGRLHSLIRPGLPSCRSLQVVIRSTGLAHHPAPGSASAPPPSWTSLERLEAAPLRGGYVTVTSWSALESHQRVLHTRLS